MKRREFFQYTMSLAGVGIVAPMVLTSLHGIKANAEESRRKKPADGGSDMVDVNDPTAKAIGYLEDAKKAPKAAGNKCSTCTLYSKTESRKGKEVGTCTIFPKKLVVGNGFCNSWAKKA